MFTAEVFALLKQVLLSWEVVAVTLAVIFYLSLVFYVARLRRPPRAALFAAKPKPPKPPKPKAEEEVEVEAEED